MFNPLFTQAGGYQIDKSLRFRQSASARLSKTPILTSVKKWTLSVWVKRSDLGAINPIFTAYINSTNKDVLRFNANDSLYFASIRISAQWEKNSTALYRDPASWYHVLAVVDTDNATAEDRTSLYVNGTRITSWATSTNPVLGYANGIVNTANIHNLGGDVIGAVYLDGYLSEINFVDGQALTPSSFGETDLLTGSWIPKRYSGSYGTNGFYLPFSDGTSLTTLGYDDSGNNNDWTLNNVSLTAGVTYDWMNDTPTDNFEVYSPLVQGLGDPSNGGLSWIVTTSNLGVNGTFPMSTGAWYYETTLTTMGSQDITLGVISNQTLGVPSAGGYGWGVKLGRKWENGAVTTGFPTAANGDVIGVAFDADSGALDFYKNNTLQFSITGLPTGVPYFSSLGGGGTAGSNTIHSTFGQRPYTYTPPTGYLALSTKNLPVPTVKRGDNYFNAKTRTGTGASFSVTGERFSPALVWTKSRSAATDHALYDAVRGATAQLESNTTTAETTETTGVTAFNSDGFSGGALAQINTNAATYVDYMWKEAAGFMDIVTYTGNGANRSIAHSLGVAPELILVKCRSAVNDWAVYHGGNTSAPETDYLLLNSTAITADDNTYWNDTAPDSSNFSVGTNADVNTNAETYVAYLFAEVEGFSKMGSYTGNGSADGPFVWCGFRPRFVLIKRTSTAVGNWYLWDSVRNTLNVVGEELYPNLSNAGSTASDIDILSNGFKIRATSAGFNASGSSYVFWAIAERPFKYANAR